MYEDADDIYKVTKLKAADHSLNYDELFWRNGDDSVMDNDIYVDSADDYLMSNDD